MSDHDIELVSFDICPYVERSRIVLEEKDVDYDITFIELDDKPDWFLEISPRGKVPVLKVDDRPVFESAVINELLEELFPEPALFPEEPLDRADARAWITFSDGELMGPSAQLYMGDDPDAIDEAHDQLEAALERLDDKLADADGPFFYGDDFSLVDAVYAPIFNRWPIVEEEGGDGLLDDRDHVSAYADALVERDSVQAARDDELLDKMRERF